MRPLKNLISMISGFSDVSLSLKTIFLHLCRHQDTPNNPRQIPTLVQTYYFRKFDIRFEVVKRWDFGFLKVATLQFGNFAILKI